MVRLPQGHGGRGINAIVQRQQEPGGRRLAGSHSLADHHGVQGKKSRSLLSHSLVYSNSGGHTEPNNAVIHSCSLVTALQWFRLVKLARMMEPSRCGIGTSLSFSVQLGHNHATSIHLRLSSLYIQSLFFSIDKVVHFY